MLPELRQTPTNKTQAGHQDAADRMTLRLLEVTGRDPEKTSCLVVALGTSGPVVTALADRVQMLYLVALS